jgi:heme oxygenase
MMKRLRAETREQHEALEGALPLGSPELSRDVYARMLCAFWGFYKTWETTAMEGVPEALRQVVKARRKLRLLEADLAFLGQAPGEVLDAGALPDLTTEAGMLGSMYVVEGSTLGGQGISRLLERKLGMEGGRGYSFFQSYGRAVGQQWKEFGALVEAMPESAGDAMVASARQTFTAFHRWLEAEVPACWS